MSSLVIVGAQWGDEAKGKLVDVFSDNAAVVVRYGGGNNAGHTIIHSGKEFRLQLLPAGVLRPSCTAILGSGMVVDPKSLLEEFQRTLTLAGDLGRLLISQSAHVVMPYHRLLDQLEEEARGAHKIGTTSRGIGPAYTDKVARTGIRMGEFVDPSKFKERLAEVLAVKNRLLTLFDHPVLDERELYDEYAAYAHQIRPWVTDTESVLMDFREDGANILFEGAQGTFLDLDHGTYPYVTSSHPIAGGATLGTGLGPRAIDNVMGVAKAYTTRVGTGPFPTELDNAIGEQIRQQGQEFGTVTGRPRRCGWLDLVLLRHSSRINSMSSFALTRLDTMAGLSEVKVATAYRLGDQILKAPPSQIDQIAAIEPIYETFPGWDADLRGCRNENDLPTEVRNYVAFIEERLQIPASVLSVGPDRSETIVRRPDLVWR